jgi:3-keto-5-aminohexanoate cleavage enzyme
MMNKKKLGPGISIYEPNFLRSTLAYEKAGKLPQGAFVKFYMAGDYNFMDGKKGYQFWGLPATEKGVAAYREMMQLTGSKLPWAVTVMGGDVTATGLSKLAIDQGGHIRLGLEDYCGPRQPRNIELVEEVVALARKAGRPLATTQQAAEILNLPRKSAKQ